MRSSPRGEALETALVAAGLTALAVTGGADGVAAGVALVPAVLASAVRPMLPRWAGRAVWGLGVVAALAVWWSGAGVDTTVGVLLVGLALHQRVAGPEVHPGRVLLLVVTLMLVAAAVRTTSPAFLTAWVAWSLALPRALAPMTSRGAGARWLLVAAVLPCALLAFLLLPRRGASLEDEDRARTGLAEEVRLGAMSELSDDAREAARVRFLDGPIAPVTLRSAAYERFDGVRWFGVVPLRGRSLRAQGPVRQVAVAHASFGGPVLVPGQVVAFEPPADFRQDVLGAWHGPRTEPIAYRAEVVLDGPRGARTLRADERSRALALPDDMDPRVLELARSWTLGTRTPQEVVRAITEALRSYRYSRVVVPAVDDPLTDFLLRTRRGHCEYFAASVAVLARASGVPARVATGLAGGRRTDDGWVFQHADSHAWAEVHFEGEGWVAIDATVQARPPTASPAEVAWPSPDAATPPPDLRPPWARWLVSTRAVWDRHFLRFDAGEQAALWSWTLGAVPWWGWAIVVVVALGLLWRRRGLAGVPLWPRRARRRPGVAGAWDRALASLARQGLVAPAELPPLAAGAWLAQVLPRTQAAAVTRLAWLHVEVRFGGADEAHRVAEAERLAAALGGR